MSQNIADMNIVGVRARQEFAYRRVGRIEGSRGLVWIVQDGGVSFNNDLWGKLYLAGHRDRASGWTYRFSTQSERSWTRFEERDKVDFALEMFKLVVDVRDTGRALL